ncbi:MAG: threonine dehydratase [Marinibacterium sp.]
MFTLSELEDAARLVHRSVPPTLAADWPLLSAETGVETWVKHENHTPTGAFKVRGGVTFVDWLRREKPDARGICTATRGNHGQSQARAAAEAGLRAVIYCPHGNSVEKNAAMRAFGAELVEFGDDFDAAREEAMRVAERDGFEVVPPFHRELVRGVASYALELFRAAPRLDAVYVPVGCGSGICGTIAARDALGLKTEVIGVVSEAADCVVRSLAAGDLVETDSAGTFADGMAVRVPVRAAFDIYREGASRFVAVSDAAVADAIRLYYRTTHNLAEGAGAAPLAALLGERDRMRGRRVGVILSGGNIDMPKFAEILSGRIPAP